MEDFEFYVNYADLDHLPSHEIAYVLYLIKFELKISTDSNYNAIPLNIIVLLET